ncbi:SRPBCC family protein [Streptomyces sp. NBC_01476]|uniref:SRPBCC family protein n=1 Tax=Streptomyces sp. NBC_01476 TaxID=2903881 RepID=UPI002E35B739|nr:SRPBCC family protein [Streptomyces sp. NBC_01476]
MAPFVIQRDTALPPAEAWRRLTTWERHTASVPFTRIAVTTPPPSGIGTVFTAHTGVGRLGFDDPMRVTEWSPPGGSAGGGHCRLEKTGRFVTGWAEIDVVPRGPGSRVRWREELRVWHLPHALDRLTAVTGRLVFGRALDTLLAG